MRRLIYALLIIVLCSTPVMAEGKFSLPSYGTSYDGLPYVRFDTTIDVDEPCVPGKLKWNSDDGTVDVCTNIDGHTIQIGQEMAPRVVNKSGSTITNGQVVNIIGAQGNRIASGLANAASLATSRVIGVATSDIEDNAEGPVALIGKARGIDTTDWTAGDLLFLSATEDGAIVNSPPDAPNRKTFIGIAENSTVNGSVWVTIANGRPLWGQNDVYNQVALSVANDILVHDGTAWTNTADIIVNTITYSGDYWDDQQIALGALGFGVSAPSWGNYKGGRVLVFEGGPADVNKVAFNGQPPHKYKEGTDIDLHIHWVLEDGSSCNVVWDYTFSWANIDAAFPAETSGSVTIAASGVVDKHTLSDIVEMTGTDKDISSLIIWGLTRDATDGADTCDNLDVYLLQADFHYMINTPGSRQELVK